MQTFHFQVFAGDVCKNVSKNFQQFWNFHILQTLLSWVLANTFFTEHLRTTVSRSSKLLTKGLSKFTLSAFLATLVLVFSSNKSNLPPTISLITQWGAWLKERAILLHLFENGRLNFCPPDFRNICSEFLPKQINFAIYSQWQNIMGILKSVFKNHPSLPIQRCKPIT